MMKEQEKVKLVIVEQEQILNELVHTRSEPTSNAKPTHR